MRSFTDIFPTRENAPKESVLGKGFELGLLGFVEDAATMALTQCEAQKREIEDLMFSRLLTGEEKEAETDEVASSRRLSSVLAEDDIGSVQSDGTMRRRRFSALRSTSAQQVEAARRSLEADRELLGRSVSVESEGFIAPKSSAQPRLSTTTRRWSVVMLGGRRTGKTMLVDRLLGSARVAPKPTVGVEHHEASVEGESVRVWDTSGDSRFEESAAGLTRTAAAVAVVYRSGDRDSFAVAADRLLRARCDAPAAKMALVATTIEAPDDADVDKRAGRLAASTGAKFVLIDPRDAQPAQNLFADLCTSTAGDNGSSARADPLLDDSSLVRLANDATVFTAALALLVLLALAIPAP